VERALLWGSPDERRGYTSLITPGVGENWGWVYSVVGRFLGNSVGDFGNEGVVFDEGVIRKRLRFAESESDESQRNPVVQFLDNASVAENDLVHDDVVSVFLVFRHSAPPRCWIFREGGNGWRIQT